MNNSILIKSFYSDKNDCELKNLIFFLLEIRNQDNL